MLRKRPLIALFLVFILAIAAPGLAATLEQQRSRFLDAEKALKSGDEEAFERHLAALGDYPLQPYLEYQAMLRRLSKASDAEVERFLEKHRETPLDWQLRARWLDHLADNKQWSRYLAFYTPTSNVSRRCHRLTALIATGKADLALSEVPEIWLHGRSQPRACDPVFDAWTKAGHRTAEMVWRRIELAMEAGERRLAKYLGRSLGKNDRIWLERWIALHRTPSKAGEAARFADAHPYREVMLSHAIRRLARWDGSKAMQLWQQIKPRYAFDASLVRVTEQYIMRNLERIGDASAYEFVRSVEVGDDDLLAHHARIRAALLREDWPQVMRWIAAMPEDERKKETWLYWLARALEAEGRTGEAAALYERVSRDRTYYGFLAADRIGGAYHLAHAETPVSQEEVDGVARLASMRRAAELFALERWTDARREWRTATRGMDAKQLKAAAKLAKQRGWHDRAIFTLARTGFWDDLELRFPLEHAELVEANAQRHGIDIAWIFAVMRQESAFMDNARSHAGAMGLMQLMPATARNVARKVLKRSPPRHSELYEPDTNIALGSAYLKQIKGELGDSAVLATAAYNAGPHRVTRWLPDRTLPADIWIELVPFKETRGYLRRVLAYTVIYEKRMGLEPTRLEHRLHPVPPSISLIGSVQTAANMDSAG